MIDIHCHILPNLDDGAKSFEESIKMLEIAKGDGIEEIVATPHIYPEFYFPDGEKIKNSFEELKIKAKEFSIELYLGTDLHLTPESIKYLKEGKAFPINFGNYVLVEPPEFFYEKEMTEMLFSLRGEGYIPIITHPERYQIFREKMDLLKIIVEQGNYLQLTSASITGYFGENVINFCKSLFKKNLVHLIASDAHSPRKRVPALKGAYELIEEWEGLEYVNLLKENAKNVILNKGISNFERKKEKRKWVKKILNKLW